MYMYQCLLGIQSRDRGGESKNTGGKKVADVHATCTTCIAKGAGCNFITPPSPFPSPSLPLTPPKNPVYVDYV